MNDLHTWNHRPLLEGHSRAWQLRLSHLVGNKQTEKLTELSMTNPTSTRGSCRPRRLQKVIQTMVQLRKKTNGNANQVVNDNLFVDKRKPSSITAVKGYLHNGEHTLIPVTVKMIHSAVQDCKRFILKDG